jgi:DNA-binding transcriptional ArsR family regulator
MVEYSDERLNAVFGALAHPVRRRVLERLGSDGARVTELAAPFEISLAAVSKHIRILEDAGLLRRVVHGREHQLILTASPLLSADRWLDSYRRFWDPSLDRLDAMLRGDRR